MNAIVWTEPWPTAYNNATHFDASERKPFGLERQVTSTLETFHFKRSLINTTYFEVNFKVQIAVDHR